MAPASRCEYLPDQTARLEYEHVERMTAAEYSEWLLARLAAVRPPPVPARVPVVPPVPVAARAGRRVPAAAHAAARVEANANAHGAVRLQVGVPFPTTEKRRLYERFHRYQQVAKGWPAPDADAMDAFADNPFPTEEWCYVVDERLVAVGYVDALPDGLSAIYFFYDPDERHRSLGTFNVLSIVDAARQRGLPWVYLGYYVEGCRSVEYKGRFRPNEVLRPDGTWGPFLS